MNKFLVWKNAFYNKDSGGYYLEVITGFKTYFSEVELNIEYTKLKQWCDTDAVYKAFRFGYEYDKYF